jgi:hypothetical protein
MTGKAIKTFQFCTTINPHKWDLLEAVSDAYEQNDQDVTILKRTLFVTSNELSEPNKLIKKQLDTLGFTQEQLQ